MINKDIEQRLIEMYIKGWITEEELKKELERLSKKEMPEPPTIY